MNTSKTNYRGRESVRGYWSLAGILAALVFLIGITFTQLEAQGRRSGGGRAVTPRGRVSYGQAYSSRYYGGGWWHGPGWAFAGGVIYSDLVGGPWNDYVIWPPANYVPYDDTQYVVPATSTPASNTGAKARLVYDSTGKPIGILLLNSDGSQEYVPITS